MDQRPVMESCTLLQSPPQTASSPGAHVSGLTPAADYDMDTCYQGLPHPPFPVSGGTKTTRGQSAPHLASASFVITRWLCLSVPPFLSASKTAGCARGSAVLWHPGCVCSALGWCARVQLAGTLGCKSSDLGCDPSQTVTPSVASGSQCMRELPVLHPGASILSGRCMLGVSLCLGTPGV